MTRVIKTIKNISPIFIFILLVCAFTQSGIAQTIQEDPEQLRGIDVIEHLNDTIPLDLTFTDDKGEQVQLSQYFNRDKPVVLILGYYTCPMLCNLVFNGVSDAVKEMDWKPGEEFTILTVSIDPSETEVVASAKKKNYINYIGKSGIADGWIFMTGEESQSKALADAVGFQYYYDEKEEQYAHAAVIMILTESGKISRYFYGIKFDPRDLKFALMDASEGKVGSAVDKVLLYCFHYDPEAGSYTVVASNVMKLGGVFTLLILGILMGALWIKERRKKSKTAENS